MTKRMRSRIHNHMIVMVTAVTYPAVFMRPALRICSSAWNRFSSEKPGPLSLLKQGGYPRL